MRRRRPDLAIFLLWVGPGGKETVLWNLARSFLALGLSVDVVLAFADSGHEHRIPAGVRVVDLAAPGYRRATLRLAAYLRRFRPRALLSTIPFSAIPAMLSRLIAPVGTRVVLRVCNNLPMRIEHESAAFPRKVRVLLRLLPRFARAVVACSRGVAESAAPVIGIHARDFTVIGNPAILPDLAGAAAASPEHWFASAGDGVILGAGRLARQKDFPMLIRALAEVRKSADVSLIVLGEGSERRALERLIRELRLEGHVLLPGRVENPSAYMARCRVFALSSAWEGFGNVIVEALAMGAPVVSTDCPSGPAEILDGGRYGALVPVGDHEAMARAILAVLNGERREVPDEWLGRFGAESVARRFLDLFGWAAAPGARHG